MFRCGICKVVQLPRVLSTPVILKTRPTEYLNHRYDTEMMKTVEVRSKGTEIVREVKACPTCASNEFVKLKNAERL